MPRIILLTDFSEEYSKKLQKGIVDYSKEHDPWVLCKMPMSYRDLHGMEGVLNWALRWKADGIIAQFRDSDNVKIFKEAGIIAVAQDFESRFKDIPNITGAYYLTGKIGANYFIEKGFEHFAFCGFKDIVWSQERFEGFRDEIKRHHFEDRVYAYQDLHFSDLWFYESEPLVRWLESLPKPIAMMTCDDNQGHHITEVCKFCKIRVPEEISILGVDNDETVCTLSDPPMSSIALSIEKGGYETARLIDQLIADKNARYEDVIVHPTHIITRQSTDIFATNDKYVSIVLKYIHQNTDQKLNVEDIARLVPLSRRLLENRFKQATGSPIYQYIYHLRMEKFAQKLLETTSPVSELALEMGFADYKNISRQFKATKGLTPSEYRIKNKSF